MHLDIALIIENLAQRFADYIFPYTIEISDLTLDDFAIQTK